MTSRAKVEWQIRRMTVADLDEVMAIDRDSFPVPWSERSYRFELLENPVAALFVAQSEPDRQILGYVGLWELVDEGHISTLAVHPDYRRQGIAKSLILKSLRHFFSKGIETASLEVRRSNQAAQDLYSKFGFEKLAVRRGYYRDNKEDALVMTLKEIPAGVIGMEVQGESESGA